MIVLFLIDEFDDTGKSSDWHLFFPDKNSNHFFHDLGGQQRMENKIFAYYFWFFLQQLQQLLRGLLMIVFDLPNDEPIFHAGFSSQFGPSLLIWRQHHNIAWFCLKNFEEAGHLWEKSQLFYFVQVIEND